MSIIITLLILGVLIIAHELGHFLTAKGAGIRVEEFGIGLGPKIFALKKGETLYTLRLLPLGGFNKMSGMEPGEEHDPKGFNSKSVGARAVVIAAGSLMNFLLAILIFMFLFMAMGIPSNKNIIANVLPNGVAANAGLKAGDEVVAIDGKKITNWDEMSSIVKVSSGKNLNFTVLRGEEKIQVDLVPKYDEQQKVGLIGVEKGLEKQNPFKSFLMGVEQTYDISKLILVSFYQMITGKIAAEVAGPVGMVDMVGQVAKFGWVNLLSFTAMLSINLGLINLFPIPALDGSRLIFLGIEKIRRKPIKPEKENFAHMIGFFLLISLMLIITYFDINRLFR